MRRRQISVIMRAGIFMATAATTLVQVIPADAGMRPAVPAKPRHVSELPPGRTDHLTPSQRKAFEAEQARQAAERLRNRPDVRPLTTAEMRGHRGSGMYRNQYFAGTLPWQRSFRDVNMNTGNLFKSFTDIQVQGGHGAGLALQRTYNSNDGRVGPFGVGWTHAYDITCTEEAQSATSTDTTLNYSDRQDFFGARHKYHRDADGLYSPPAYLYDEHDGTYDDALAGGPISPLDDSDIGQDGTVKHYQRATTSPGDFNGNNAGPVRWCDFIQDRYGNFDANNPQPTQGHATLLAYQDATYGSVTFHELATVTDPSGRQLVFTWANVGTSGAPMARITRVDLTDGNGATVYSVAYAYGSDGNLSSSTLDPGGLNRTTSYTYTSVSDSNNNTETGLLASVTVPNGTGDNEVVSYTYTLGFTMIPLAPSGLAALNAPGTTPTNTVWVSTIAEPGGVDTSNNPRTVTWTVNSWIETEGSPSVYTTITDQGYVFTWDERDSSTSDGNNCETQVPAVGVKTYADANLRNFMTGNFYSEHIGNSQIYSTYDSANNVLTVGKSNNGWNYPGYAGGMAGYADTDYFTYGTVGNVLTHSTWGFPGTETTTWYDASQYFQKHTFTDKNGHTTTFGVGDRGGADPSNAGMPPAVGNRGNVLWVQDANNGATGAQFSYTYNGYGQKATETNLNGVTTTYTYGEAGRDAATSLGSVGNLTTVVQDPGTGHLNRTTHMSYDVSGHVLQSQDPMGHTSSFSYNTLGQPTEASFPSSGSTPAENISYAYGANGRTTSVTDNRGTTTLAYERGCDRVSSVTDPVTGATSYTYAPTGERLTMALPGGGTWTYGYAGAHGTMGLDPTVYDVVLPKDDPNSVSMLLSTITDDQGRQVIYWYNTLGMPMGVTSDQAYTTTNPPTLASWQYTGYLYSRQLSNFAWQPWIGSLSTNFNVVNNGVTQTTLLSENDYTYDNTGQRLTNTITDNTGAQRTENYGYDALNRLTSVNYGDGQTQGYTFDAMGNRLTKTDSATGNEGYWYDDANRLVSRRANGTTGAYTSDANGNTLTGGGRTSTWDSQNRMATCAFQGNNCSYVYGCDGIRHQSTVNGTTTNYVLDNSMFVREQRGGSNYATYLVGPRGPEYRRDDTTGAIRWYVYDGLGSVAAEVDPNGTVTAKRKYDVYGLVRSGDAGTSAHKFVGALGHPSEAETGLVYMRARYTDPAIGRFVSEDPERHGLDWFVYARGNPAFYRDRTGKDDDSIEGEEVGELGEADLEATVQSGAPSALRFATQHGADTFYRAFAKISGRMGSVHDLDELLNMWNAGMAQIGNMPGTWAMRVQFYNAMLVMIVNADGDLVNCLDPTRGALE